MLVKAWRVYRSAGGGGSRMSLESGALRADALLSDLQQRRGRTLSLSQNQHLHFALLLTRILWTHQRRTSQSRLPDPARPAGHS